jgi:antitoxin HicB
MTWPLRAAENVNLRNEGTNMARKTDVTRKKKGIRSTAKLTTLDDFLGEEGKRDEFEAIAVKEVLAWQIGQAMKENNISRNNLAQRMKTSRSQIGRLLDPKDGNVTLATLQRAARMVGRSLRLELV